MYLCICLFYLPRFSKNIFNEKTRINAMKSFPITNIPEFSNKDRIVVIGIIGKSAYRYPNKAASLLPNIKSDENGIECVWDDKNSVLYLHAVTYFDTNSLAELATKLGEEPTNEDTEADAGHWLVASGELAVESCRFLALLFHLCHLVILTSPGSVFDLGYLQLFKAIDAFRRDISHEAIEYLIEAGLEGAWESHGRLCCPRLLFHFRSAPRQLRKVPASLKKLEHAVEDQLYSILRKTRIITNVCTKSLFAIPKNEEFVYINADEEMGRARDLSVLLRGLVKLCAGESASVPGLEGRPSFPEFLQTHIDLAFGEGFDDNVGKYAMSTSFFENQSGHFDSVIRSVELSTRQFFVDPKESYSHTILEKASSWRLAAQTLTPLYISQESPSKSSELDKDASALWTALATDVRFSKARCAKVLPIAQASYTEGLPPHYSSQHHKHKLEVSVRVLETLARGPLAAKASAQLAAACEAAWKSRRLCEALSLMHNSCVLPQHDNTVEHSSGIRYTCACSCGRSRTARDDPYSIRHANYTFYVEAADLCGHCADGFTAYPVFEPSTATAKPVETEEEPELQESQEIPEGAWSPSTSQSYLVKQETIEKGIVRQPSTTEYLPHFLTEDSPEGVLPAYSAWTLTTLGPSSLYSHSVGLLEHLQPGFLSHSNYLVPWDCALRVDQTFNWRPSSRGRNATGKHHQPTVKIFIGIEYECSRGHRFMMSSPDTVVCGSAMSGGAALIDSDMPLYNWCACRQLAQLMRLHVVTPKAPVHVVIEPRVQTSASGPVYIPSASPTALPPAAYCVVRLPLAYRCHRPRAPPPGALLRAPLLTAP